MELAAGYKQSHVGVVPEAWQVQPMLKVLQIANGQVDPQMEPYRSMVLVAPDHIESETGRLLARQTASEQHAISGKYLFNRGDVLYSKIRPYLRKAMLAEFDGLCSADIYPLKLGPSVSGGFMLAVLLGHRFTKFTESVSARSGIPKVNRAEMAEFFVALPPSCEQRAIAAALDDVDALLNALDQLIVKKRDIKQATMQQLLTGQTRLFGFDGEWKTKQLGAIAEIEMGQSPSSVHYNMRGDGLPLVQGNADVSNRKTESRVFTTDITKIARTGDVLMSVRAPVGKVSRATADVCLGRGVCAIRYPNDFLYHYMVFLEPMWSTHSKGSTFDSVDSIEQLGIASVLADMDAEIAALEARHIKTQDLKRAMTQELLTGRTRLVKPEAVNA